MLDWVVNGAHCATQYSSNIVMTDNYHIATIDMSIGALKLLLNTNGSDNSITDSDVSLNAKELIIDNVDKSVPLLTKK